MGLRRHTELPGATASRLLRRNGGLYPPPMNTRHLVRQLLRRVLTGWLATLAVCLVLGGWGLSESEARAAMPDALRSASWSVVNDTVMGGRSSATITWNAAGHLEWRGRLSLENNGGFVSIRSGSAWADWAAFDAVEVVLEGQGRDVQVSVQREGQVLRAGGYRAMLPTKVAGETRAVIPLSAFIPKRFGREVRAPSLARDKSRLGDWGLLIADKRQGQFSVTLKSLRGVRRTDKQRPSPGVREALLNAIERGVPVFNSGDADGCARIYTETLRTAIESSGLPPGSWSQRLAETALVRASMEDRREAAWTLRRAMDAILRSLPEG